MAEHAPFVSLLPASGSEARVKAGHVPTCSCGWRGMARLKKADAQRDALNHARDAAYADNDDR